MLAKPGAEYTGPLFPETETYQKSFPYVHKIGKSNKLAGYPANLGDDVRQMDLIQLLPVQHEFVTASSLSVKSSSRVS